MARYTELDALLAEIERRIKHYNLAAKEFGDEGYKDNVLMEQCKANACERILSFLNTLEVKEVDLEKEIKEEYLKHRQYGGRGNMLVILHEPQFNKIAKHFFELGLQAAQKGE